MDILNKLGIKDINFGGCSGPGNWTRGKNDGLTESFNPSNGQLIASVYNCSEEEYLGIVKESHKSFLGPLHHLLALFYPSPKRLNYPEHLCCLLMHSP